MEDWPTLGVAHEKKPVTNGVAKQNGNGSLERAGSHEDSDESQSSQLNNHERSKKGASLK